MKVDVSVVMPVYNSEKYLEMAIESILKQTMKSFELICIDDGSQDSSLEILNEYANRDERIKVITQNNRYAGAARNCGIDHAIGEYIIFLDSDDFFDCSMLEKNYRKIKEYNADIVVFGGKYFKEEPGNGKHHEALLRKWMLPEGEVVNNTEKIKYLFNFTTPAPWNKMFSMAFIQKNELRFQECKRYNDAFFVEMALFYADKIAYVDEDLVFYRTDNSNSLQGKNDETPFLVYDVYRLIHKKLKGHQQYEEVKISFQNLALSNFIYNLDSLKEGKNFAEVYDYLKDTVFEEFDITKSNEENYHYKYPYHQYQDMMKMDKIQFLLNRNRNNSITAFREYIFPFEDIVQNSKLLLYGAGNVGKQFYRQIKTTKYCKEVAWVDKNVREVENVRVVQPESVDWKKYDYVVIAVESCDLANKIKIELQRDYKVNENQLVWREPKVKSV